MTDVAVEDLRAEYGAGHTVRDSALPSRDCRGSP